MSGEITKLGSIEGYTIAVFKSSTDEGDVIMEQDLKLSKVGGAHITNVADIVMMIEDAVFQKEAECDVNPPTYKHTYQDDGDPRCIHCNKPA